MTNMKIKKASYIAVPGTKRSTIHFRYKITNSFSFMPFEKEKNHTVLMYMYNLCKVCLQASQSLHCPSSATYFKHRTKEFLVNSKLDTGLSTLLNRDI